MGSAPPDDAGCATEDGTGSISKTHPRTGFCDRRDTLASLEIDFKHPVAKTGIVGSIGSGEPVVALRADMDALPIQVQQLFAMRLQRHQASASHILGALSTTC